MALKNSLRKVSKSPWSKALAAATYCTSACACFKARSMAWRLLKRWANPTISGRTNTSARLTGFFSCIPSSDVHRLSATYACPPANTPPVKSMTTRLKVSPWLLWTVMAHASRTGYWVKFLIPLPQSVFFLRCICSGYSARTPVSHHIPCRRR